MIPTSVNDFTAGDIFGDKSRKDIRWEVLEVDYSNHTLKIVTFLSGTPLGVSNWFVPNNISYLHFIHKVNYGETPVIRKIKQMEQRRKSLGYRW